MMQSLLVNNSRDLFSIWLSYVDSKGTLVASVLAMDKDKTEIGKIKYGIVDGKISS